jgi:translation initiation factor IF-3
MANKYSEFSQAGNAPTNPNERKKFRKGKKSFKEVKMRPNIGDNDFSVKLKQIVKFLEKGLQVRITVSIRGRQNIFKAEHLVLFDKIKEATQNIGNMAEGTKQAGSNYMRTINPVSQKKKR